MKKKYFFILWGCLLAFCVVLGIITRSHFQSMPTDPAHMGALPWNYPYSAEWYHHSSEYEQRNNALSFQLGITPEELLSEAECVVSGRFTGERQAVNMGFLSDFQVDTVFKGDSTLKDTTIRVYEPFRYRPPVKEIEHFSSYSQLTMMVPDTDYLLLLTPRTFPEGMKAPSAPEYVYFEKSEEFLTEDGERLAAMGPHPYTKFILSTDQLCKPVQEELTAEQSVRYECLLPSEDMCQKFIETKHALLQLWGCEHPQR